MDAVRGEAEQASAIVVDAPTTIVLAFPSREPGAPTEWPPVPAVESRRAPVWIWLLVVVAIAAFFRLHALDRVGFSSDEAVYSGQAASIAGSRAYSAYFPIYRAHPLLFQALLALVYGIKLTDFVARVVAVSFGIGTVLVSYQLGSLLYGRRAGIFTAGVLAIMPYHVLVSRQVLLDGPEVFFATIALYAIARYRLTPTRTWMLAVAGSLGLTFLTKETGIVLVGALLVYLALDPDLRVNRGDLALGGLLFGAMAVTYPIATAIGGAARTGGSYVLWQVLRAPNHGFGLYLGTVLPAIGILAIAAAALGLVALRRYASWRERLLLVWIVVPFTFFELWPVKGYQYLLAIAPPIAALAGRALAALSQLRGSRRVATRVVRGAIVAAVGLSLIIPAWSSINSASAANFLAGRRGVPGGREAGRWTGAHIPVDAQMLAIGPSMANILQFYGGRKVWALAVSADPHARNPVYVPVKNPDLVIRNGVISYLVWDTYSAQRSAGSAARLLRYVRKYHGHLVHAETAGTPARPVIQIFEVRP